MEQAITSGATVTIGLDLGDRMTEGCVMDATGAVVERFRTRTTRARVVPTVARYPGARVILEVGSQPPWLSRALTAAGCDVIVANARRVRLIAEHDAKSDRLDAKLLARLGRVDPTLLAPIQHRGEQAQRDLSLLRTRASLEVGQSFRAAGASPQGDARFRASASSRTSGR
ncbi:MAG: transposase [Vicinamibacterales bacterium]|nr:transposase [Vicinamibacterales bacterium]